MAQDATAQDHTVTISADDGTNDAVTETFTITVTDVSFAPAITDPGDKSYAQGESITAFDITVTDADGDTPTVTVTGLPSGLSYASGQVSGTVAQDATVQDHTVTISADDGTNDAVTETFTITVTDVSFAPAITDPGDKTYAQGESITAFDITVTDADGDTPTVTVTGPALGTVVRLRAGQAARWRRTRQRRIYTVTISADDGTNDAVTETFTITVTDVSFAPAITDPGDKSVCAGGVDHGVRHHGDGRGRGHADGDGHGPALGTVVRLRAGQRHGGAGRDSAGLHGDHQRRRWDERRGDGDLHHHRDRGSSDGDHHGTDGYPEGFGLT